MEGEKDTGAFIISLDFELNWGVHDVLSLEQYEENLLGARTAIPKILELFREFNIHATWATVGMLDYDSKEELLENLPPLRPSYTDTNLSPYNKLHSIGSDEQHDPIHFAPSLIGEIANTPHQELASHTFSHYYCLEKGQSIEEFEADLIASIDVLSSRGSECKTLVFPRNQTNQIYLQVCEKHGLTSYRGNEKSWVYRAIRSNSEGLWKRLFRLLDHYVNIFGHHTYPIKNVDCNPIVNLPSSRFLRPYHNRLKSIEPLRLRRIKNSMKHAAVNGEVYHLWWHPHNFGKNTDENIMFLTEILKWMDKLRNDYGFNSLSMREASLYVAESKEVQANDSVQQKISAQL